MVKVHYMKMVDQKKIALAVQAVNLAQEDYATYLMLALQLEKFTRNLLEEIDVEIEKIQRFNLRDFENFKIY